MIISSSGLKSTACSNLTPNKTEKKGRVCGLFFIMAIIALYLCLRRDLSLNIDRKDTIYRTTWIVKTRFIALHGS
jgi:hypothetical protein